MTGHGGIILAVDDNEAHCYALVQWLTRAGYLVRQAFNGTEALRMANQLPDLIVLDINMPDVNGLEVCRRLRADSATAHIPVIIVTSSMAEEPARRAAESLGASFLAHPFNPEELVAIVRENISRRRAAQANRTGEAS